MTIDDDAAYQVLLARDARFDGRLYVGVTSTGVYCRPVCRVRTPARRNCRFFSTPARAEAASFRPCLKCRPEIAPGQGLGWSVMDASRTLAVQAANALDALAASGDAPRISDLASRLGVSDRHLRRIFLAEHGVGTLQYLQTRRLLLAKHLLTDTTLPISQVALCSGFRSLRRFNAAFAAGYRMNPSRLRRSVGNGNGNGNGSGNGNGNGDANSGGDFVRTRARSRSRDGAAALDAGAVTVKLAYRPPHDAATFVAFIGQRAIAGVETVDGLSVRRTLRAGALAGGTRADASKGVVAKAIEPSPAGWLEARFLPQASRVQLTFSSSLGHLSGTVIAAARRWLDLDASPDTIDAALTGLPGAPGLRLPGSLDGFELAVRAILGQQVTVAGARTLARRLVERFGADQVTPWPGVIRVFAAPEVLAEAPIERIAELGIIRSRAAAIADVARAWNEIAPLLAPGAAPDRLVARLCEIKGVGPWTAHYIAMRALGWPDAFPPNDVAALKSMQRLFATGSARAAEQHARAWRPWRAYALLRLWNLPSGVMP